MHPLEVASFLADLRLDPAAIVAGLLHDVVEDTLTTVERIEELFGKEVAHLVEGVTKISAIPFSSSAERQAENFRKMLLAMVDDIRVILVKLADRLHNMRTLGGDERRPAPAHGPGDPRHLRAHRQPPGHEPAEERTRGPVVPAPRARRLRRRCRTRVERRRKATEGLIDDFKKAVRTALDEAQVPVIEIDGRIKRLYSIHLKLRRQKIDLEQVYDFLAVRIITKSVKDCYACLGVIHHAWPPVPGRIKDFIATPRPNGYQSLHTSVMTEKGVPIEVQIRTEEMHRQAEEGIASHWKYKEGRVGAANDERYFQWLRQMLEWQQEVRDPQEFIQNLKVDLYPDEVYTFTPKGEVKSLPRNATVIDFAYAIHTIVGPPVRGRAHQRQDDAAAHAPPERRRRRDRHQPEAQAQPRLAELRGDDAGAQPDQAVPAQRGEERRGGAGPEAAREGSPPFRRQRQDAVRDRPARPDRAGVGRPGRRPTCWRPLAYGKVGASQVPGESRARRPAAGREEGVGGHAPRSNAPWASGPTTSRCAAPTTCWSSAPAAAAPSRAKRIVGYITRGKGVSVHAVNCPNVTNLLFDPERRIDGGVGPRANSRPSTPSG